MNKPFISSEALEVCTRCRGSCVELDSEGEVVGCSWCGGGGYEEVEGDLGSTTTYPIRPFTYNPGTGRLTVARKGKRTVYVVREFVPDVGKGEKEFRAFEVEKIHPTRGVHHARIGVQFWVCDCEASTCLASQKAAERAMDRGDGQHLTFGCVHLDALVLLKNSGHLDARCRAPGGR